jgi:hypothetical protein
MAYKSKKISRLVWYPLPNAFVQWDLPFDKLDKDIYQPKIHDHMAESMNRSPKNWKFNGIIILAGGFSSKPWYMFDYSPGYRKYSAQWKIANVDLEVSRCAHVHTSG